MSGVTGEDGVQWTRCTVCTKWAKLTDLGYEPPSEAFKHGRDICLACTNQHHDIESIQPAQDWIPNYEEK